MKQKNKDNSISAKQWLTGYLVILFAALVGVLVLVAVIDPFFHYHKPLAGLYYTLDNERSQNNGIARHFDYTGVSTGTSLTANTKTTEVDELYDTNAIKATFSGASYYEINQNLETVYQNHDPNVVIRCLDMAYLLDSKDFLRIDMGEYPTYLYDDNIWNDVKYVYNRDVFFERCVPMLCEVAAGREGGITSFDDYGNWQADAEFGANAVLDNFFPFVPAPTSPGLTPEEEIVVRENITQNVASIAAAHPETTFYIYFSPVSAAWWGLTTMSGDFFRFTDAERIAIETLLPYDNIRLYSYNTMTELTTDLSNYKDSLHYGEWVNSDILRWMKEGVGELTEENYQDYLAEEKEFYLGFEYNTLFFQKE